MSERSIFLEALEHIDPSQQSAFLHTACVGDPELRLRVELLLQSHDKAGSFLGKLGPERLAEELGGCATTGESLGQIHPGDADQSLGFLTPSDKPGSIGRLGCYEIQDVIGRGGMGIVLGAFDDKLHRVVAIKVMATQLASNEHARRRFVREGRSAAAIRDDHVIGIHGVDEANGLPFLVMEYIVGRSLAERIEADGPLPLADTLRIGSQIARGLAAAHAQGLVHRDIKPANILLENGVERVKITDFGLAHAVDDVRTTQPGVVVGTPEYMSPEQARGEKVDHRSDLFSLGCVLYAMCAGRPPFRAESTVAIIRRVCEDKPRSLTEINSEIPVWLVDVIDKLIAKDASVRFQTAVEVAELLEQYLAHVQQPAVNPEPAAIAKPRPVRPHANASPNRRWLTAAVAAVLLLCAGLSLAETTGVTNVAATVIRIVRGDGTLVVEVDDPEIQVLIDGEELVITGAGPKEIRLRPGQHELHALKEGKRVENKLVTITKGGREVVKVAQERSATAAERKESVTDVGRQQPASSEPHTRRIWANAVKRRFWGGASPDGKYVSFVDWSGDVAVRELATGNSRRLSNQGLPERAAYPIFSPDSRQVAYTCFSEDKIVELRSVGLDGSQPRVLYGNKDKEVTWIEACDWSADGRYILALFSPTGGTQLVLVSVADGSLRVLKQPAAIRLNQSLNLSEKVCLSPDGRYVAYSAPSSKTSAKRDVFLLATDGSGEVVLIEHPADDCVVGWAPDGMRLVFASDRTGSPGLWMIGVAEGKSQGVAELVRPAIGHFDVLGLTRNGSLCYGTSSGGIDIYTATLDWEQDKLLKPPVLSIHRSEGMNFMPAWSPDGHYLACMSNRQSPSPLIYILSLQSSHVHELSPDLLHFGQMSLEWSADGKSLVGAGASGDGKRGAFQVDVQTGTVTCIPTNERCLHPTLSLDGKALFYVAPSSPREGRWTLWRVFRRELDSGVEEELYQLSDEVNQVNLSPNGQHLAFVLSARSLKLLPTAGGRAQDLVKAEGAAWGALLTGEGFISTVAWTPDGEHILYQKIFPPVLSLIAQKVLPISPVDFRTELWRVATIGGEPQKLSATLPAMGHLRIHPDGRQITFSSQSPQTDKNEIWLLENFLPPLAEDQAAEKSPARATE